MKLLLLPLSLIFVLSIILPASADAPVYNYDFQFEFEESWGKSIINGVHVSINDAQFAYKCTWQYTTPCDVIIILQNERIISLLEKQNLLLEEIRAGQK